MLYCLNIHEEGRQKGGRGRKEEGGKREGRGREEGGKREGRRDG